MQHELIGSTFDLRWPWPEVKYWPDLSKSPCIWFDVPWREEHAGTRIKPLAFLVQKLFAKTFLAKTAILGFPVLWSLARNPLMVAPIWWYVSERTAQELSNAFFLGLPTKIVSEIMAHFWEKIWNLVNLTFDDLWWPQYWLDLKMTFINTVELDKIFLTLFWILARTHSFGDLWEGGICPPSVLIWPRPPSVRGLIQFVNDQRTFYSDFLFSWHDTFASKNATVLINFQYTFFRLI